MRRIPPLVTFFGWLAQSYHNPEDEDRDGPQNGGLFTIQPLDPVGNPKGLHCDHSPGKRQIVHDVLLIRKVSRSHQRSRCDIVLLHPHVYKIGV